MRIRKILIIYNPAAGQRQQQKFGQVLNLLKDNRITVEVVESQYGGHAAKLAASNIGAKYDLIAAAGGDGTINEVINGHYPSPKPFGLIPLGTANVLAKELGLDETPVGIATNLAAGRSRACRLGRVNSRLFSLMISVGYDAFTVAEVNLGIKKILGEGAYFLSFIRQLFLGPSLTYHLTIDGRKYTAASAIITRGKYYGGKYICAPDASLTGDDFYAVILEKKGRIEYLRYALAMLLKKLPRAYGVRIVKAKSITIKAEGQAPFQLDGDFGGHLPVEVSLAETPIHIVC